MADDTGLDLDLEELDDKIETRNKVEERITKLSSKVKKTSEDNEELTKANTELTELNETITKENKFLSSFTDQTAEYLHANEYKDAIKEKVLAGYTTEDATVSVLVKEGKMEKVTPPETEESTEEKPESPAGGSATASPTGDAEKPLDEVSQEDKLAELKERAKKGDF